MPRTTAPSAAFGAGIYIFLTPQRCALITIGKTPLILRTSPFNDSSPKKAELSVSQDSCPVDLSIAIRIGRS